LGRRIDSWGAEEAGALAVSRLGAVLLSANGYAVCA
jgi:hypothetical protein